MRKSFMIGSLFTMLVVALLAATNVPASWSLNAARTMFSVLLKDGGGTVFVPTTKGVVDGSVACKGCVGETLNASDTGGFQNVVGTSGNYVDQKTLPLTAGSWHVCGEISVANSGGAVSPGIMRAGITTTPGNVGPVYEQSQYNVGTAGYRYGLSPLCLTVNTSSAINVYFKYLYSVANTNMTVNVNMEAVRMR